MVRLPVHYARKSRLSPLVAGLLLSIVGIPGSGHAQGGPPVTDIPLETALSTVAGALSGELPLINQALAQLIAMVAKTDGDVQRNTQQLHQDLTGLQIDIHNDFVTSALAEARRQAITQVVGGYDPRAACNGANAAEAKGNALKIVANTRAGLAKTTSDWGKGMATTTQALQRVEKLPPEVFKASVAAADSGTLKPEDLANAKQFNLNLINPAPPVDPMKLPDRYKNQVGAQMYDTVFKLYNASVDVFSRAMDRSLEMLTPSVAVTDGMKQTWAEVDGSGRNMGITPVSVGGTPMVSELDALRTQVFGTYANPHWVGDQLNSMSSTQQLGKQLAEQLALSNRLMYQILVDQQSVLYAQSVAGAREVGADYRGRMDELRSAMADTH